MLELDDLRAFARIADHGSLTGAARSLNAPKSSVSRSLSRLEAALGTVLFERTTRRLHPTDAGRLLRPYAQRVLDGVEEAEAVIGAFTAGPRGVLRVSAASGFVEGLIAPMLPAFLARWPDVGVVVTSDRQAPGDEADLAIRFGPLPDSDQVARRLTAFEIWYCAGAGYVAARGAPAHPADLPSHDTIGRAEGPMTWRVPARGGQAGDEVVVLPRMVLPEPMAACVACLGGGGIARLPDYMAAPHIAGGALVRLWPERPAERIEAHALYASHRSLSAKVRVFLDALLDHVTTIRGAKGGA